MTRWWPRLLLAFFALLIFTIVFAWFVLLRPVAQPWTNDPVASFDHGSIGNETQQGLPYWIWRVLPQMFPEYLPGNQDGYAAIGVSWIPGDELPVGFSKMTLGVIPRVAPNCAFCHQGSYRLRADEPATLVPAGAGTRVNPQGYLRFLMRSAGDARFTADTIMDQITAIYAMPLWERILYRYLLIPATKQALQDQQVRFAWMDSRPDWGPGQIDPFNPVKFYNLKLPDDGTVGNSDMMPLWDLDRLVADPSRDYSLHWDGLSTSLHETVLAGAIGDGLDYQSYPRTKAALASITDFIRLQQPPRSPFSTTVPPGDPFHVDAADVEAGKALYRTHCAECHEPGGARFRTVISATELGTDRNRIDMWTEAAKDRYNAYEEDYPWGFKAFHKTNGYLANELTGLWLRGPYLHNGSVPSLRDLLAPPDQRPVSFYRGYDLVDAENGGFVSRGGNTERFGVLYETQVRGNGNGGHLYGTDLTEAEKARLLAYLKTL